jgi:hypothetical protein
MYNQTRNWLVNGSYFNLPGRLLTRYYLALIPNLPARFKIEGADGEDEFNFIPDPGRLNHLSIPQDCNKSGSRRERGVGVIMDAIPWQPPVGLQVA